MYGSTKPDIYLDFSFYRQGIGKVFRMETSLYFPDWVIILVFLLHVICLCENFRQKKWVKTVDKQKDEIGKGNHKMSSGDSRVGAEWFMSLVTQSHTRVTGHHDIYRIHHERTPESRALSILQSVSSRLWALSLYLLFLINWLRALIYLSLQNRCFPVFSYYLCLGKWPENIFLWSCCVVSSYYSTEEIIIKGELMWG